MPGALEKQTGRDWTSYRDQFAHLHRAADVVREAVREAILDGQLRPGVRLREEELARGFGVSRTPVREALQQLRMDGLVDYSPHQGATVTRLTIDDILAIYFVREALEGLSTRLAATRATREQQERLQVIVDEMERAVDPLNARALAELNLRFHAEVRRAADNRYLDRFLTEVEHAVRRFGKTTFAYPGRARASVDEHRAIVEAISAGSPEQAEAVAVQHMRAARQLRIQMLADGH